MKSLLVTAVIATFVLALFLHSGSALRCYNCQSANCDQTITCSFLQDTCIIVYHNGGNLSRCWKDSDCNVLSVSTILKLDTFKSRCCNWNLCNNAPNVVASKIVLSGTLLLTIIYMLKSLVWS